jgi:hypothetical protein
MLVFDPDAKHRGVPAKRRVYITAQTGASNRVPATLAEAAGDASSDQGN